MSGYCVYLICVPLRVPLVPKLNLKKRKKRTQVRRKRQGYTKWKTRKKKKTHAILTVTLPDQPSNEYMKFIYKN